MAIGLAIASILIAAASLAWSVHSGRKNVKAIEREEGRRTEEIALLRSAAESRAREESKETAAELVGESSGSSGSSRGVDFPVAVRNIGRHVATDVVVWLALEREAGASPISQQLALGTVVPNDDPRSFSLTQPEPFDGGKVPRPGYIVASWTDGRGPHTEPIGRLTVFV